MKDYQVMLRLEKWADSKAQRCEIHTVFVLIYPLKSINTLCLLKYIFKKSSTSSLTDETLNLLLLVKLQIGRVV